MIKLKISLGIATVIPESDCSPRDLIEMADKALYQAKNNGRNQWISLSS